MYGEWKQKISLAAEALFRAQKQKVLILCQHILLMLITPSKKESQHWVVTLYYGIDWKGQKENYVIIIIVAKHKRVML